MRRLYPLKLAATAKDAVWGGTRLKCGFGLDTPLERVAEAWTVSAHSVVQNGELAGMTLGAALARWGLGELPILVKFIDAAEQLSVQVHPDDGYARSKGYPRGKTEMWYILDCDPGASVYLGFNRAVTRGELRAAIADNSVLELLRRVPVKPGGALFVPAGIPHAIGGGVLLAEAQQNSDITYRMYDYGRLADGKPRELHIEDALACVSLAPYADAAFASHRGDALCCDCGYFRVEIRREPFRTDSTAFCAATVLRGECTLRTQSGGLELGRGESVFVPHGAGSAEFTGEFELMVVYV